MRKAKYMVFGNWGDPNWDFDHMKESYKTWKKMQSYWNHGPEKEKDKHISPIPSQADQPGRKQSIYLNSLSQPEKEKSLSQPEKLRHPSLRGMRVFKCLPSQNP